MTKLSALPIGAMPFRGGLFLVPSLTTDGWETEFRHGIAGAARPAKTGDKSSVFHNHPGKRRGERKLVEVEVHHFAYQPRGRHTGAMLREIRKTHR